MGTSGDVREENDTGAHTQRIENTWWGVKRSMPRTGTSKELFKSYLQEWLWRQHYGDDPFGNIIISLLEIASFLRIFDRKCCPKN